MKFTIGKPVVKNAIKPGLYLEIDFMHGDADKFETIRVLHTENTNAGRLEMQDAIELLLRYNEAVQRNGRSHEKTSAMLYDTVLQDEWVGDVTTDFQYRAAYRAHRVRYFDSSGVEYEVKVED